MNLPLLYWASEQIGDSRFYEIAVCQATVAANEFVREDGSVRHIVVFNDKTGKVDSYRYGQGYSVDISWGRGTAWAIYGFAISYKHTGNELFLQKSKQVADFIIKNMPSDYVPYADYLAPDEERRKKDSSTGAITACGMFLLSRLTGDNKFKEFGLKIIEGLYRTCFAPIDNQAVLLHGNTAYHAEDIADTDLSIIYGDYYFLEALLMLDGMEELF